MSGNGIVTFVTLPLKGVRRIFTVAFLLFPAPTGAFNPTGQLPKITYQKLL